MFIYLFFSAIMILSARNLVFLVLVGVLATSIWGGWLIEQPIDMFDPETMIKALFVSVALFFVFIPFNRHQAPALKRYPKEQVLENRVLIEIVIALGSLAFFVNIYNLYQSFSFLASSSLSIHEYKNMGHAKEFMQSSISPILKLVSNVFSPLSYICLAIHFYAILKEEKKYYLLSLLGAMNIIIVPLFYFARGGVLTFCLLYISMFALIFFSLTHNRRKKIIFFLVIFLIPVFSIFIYITLDRFNSYYYYRDGTIVSNVALFAVFDYLSQWITNSDILLSKFSHDKIIFASNFNYLFSKVFSLAGVEFTDLQTLRESVLSGYENHFNGLITLLVYDFGYIGTIIVCCIYFLVVWNAHKTRPNRTLTYLIKYVLILPIPLFFFQGSFTVFGFYNIAIVYSFIFSILLRTSWKNNDKKSLFH